MSRVFMSIIGRLGADPKMGGDNENLYSQFSIATDKWDSKTKSKVTEWWRVVAFGRNAEIANQYLRKGREVSIDGVPEQFKYTGKDGVEHSGVSIKCSIITLIGGKGSETEDAQEQPRPRPIQSQPRQYTPQNETSKPPEYLEDIPF